jgi:hypothetical protein
MGKDTYPALGNPHPRATWPERAAVAAQIRPRFHYGTISRFVNTRPHYSRPMAGRRSPIASTSALASA